MNFSILFLVGYGLFFVVMIYGFFFADVESKGVHGYLSRLLLHGIPRQVEKVFNAVFGKKFTNKIGEVYDYVVNQRNPILIVLYFMIINSAFLAWTIYGIPFLPNKFVPYHHVYISIAWVIICQITFVLASHTSPGVITKENIEQFSHEKCDGLIYASDTYCKTCLIPKVSTLRILPHTDLC
jgi:hypothetical protein